MLHSLSHHSIHMVHVLVQHLPEEYNSKGKLEVLVAKLGGSVVQNNLPGTHVLVASSRAKLRVQTQITAGTKDIMKPEWLIACLDEERLVEPEPRYCIFMCEATRKSMEYVVDKYGDHFTRHTTPEELKAVFALVCVCGGGHYWIQCRCLVLPAGLDTLDERLSPRGLQSTHS